MKKQYTKPTILVIEMEASELMMTSAAAFTTGNGIVGGVSDDWSDLDGAYASAQESDPWQNGLWDEGAWN